MKNYHLFLILLLSLSIFQSCVKDPIVDNGKAPQLPPEKTLLMPFNSFENLDTLTGSSNTATTRGPETFQNWFHAAVNLVVWHTATTAIVAIPVAAYGEAFNHDPVDLGNGVYEWSYQSQNANETFNIRLTGQFVNNNEDVEWIMYASKVGGFSEIVWYSGIVAVDFREAVWTLNKNPNNLEPALTIEYVADITTEEFTIRYTNIGANDPGNGDYIEFRTEPSSSFNRAYDVYRGSVEKTLNIEWSEPTNEGRVKHPERFNDSEWHCWDSEAKDTAC